MAQNALIDWKNSPIRMPLLVRGARQIGKSFLIEDFGQQYFKNIVTVNLELQKQLYPCFESLDPKQICLTISAVLEVSIIPGDTLLFLDEIQECPAAIVALRYFFEQMPDLHVIAAGSLLEFVLSDEDFSIPVGRVEYFYFHPLSFEEFLLAVNAEQFYNYIQNCSINEKIPEAIHQKGLDLVKQYCVIGGMPKVVDTFVKYQDLMLCQQIQNQLLNTYRDDFHKYGKRINTQKCETIFDKTPKLIAKHFKYKDIDPDIQSSQIKPALASMIKAGIYTNVYAVKINDIPLSSNTIVKRRKLLFLDTALIKRMSNIDAQILLTKDLHLINQGQLVEQFVGQELLAYQSYTTEPKLYYWERDAKGSSAEIDYVYQLNDKIVPIEVKSGHTGRLKSLHMFLEQSVNNPRISTIGIKISRETLELQPKILSVPFYLISQLNRLLSEIKL